jgi:hypothetical protein
MQIWQVVSASPSDRSLSQDVNSINPLVAFYDIHRRNREVLFFYFVTDTTQDLQLLDAYNLFKCFNNKTRIMNPMKMSWPYRLNNWDIIIL